jgi:ribose/xylose/arabinose/galactoside ABC-type transport system permease subunit
MSTVVLRRVRSRLAGSLHDRTAFLVGLIVVTAVIMSLISPYFLNLDNLLSMTQFGAVIGLLALGQTLVIIGGGGGIDISVGSMLSLSGVAMGLVVGQGVPVWLAAFCTLLIGLALGAFNGFLVTTIGIPALIATLGTLYLFASAAQVLAGGQQIGGFDQAGFAFIGTGTVVGIPTQVLLVLLPVYAAAAWIMRRSLFGRRVYETGNNDKALRLVGGSPNRIRFLLYCASGLLAGLGAVVTNAWLLVARPGAGDGFELQSITIAVLGGTYIFGGRGRVSGTLLAVLLIVILSSGLQLAGVDPAWQSGVLGVVLVASVVLNNLFTRRGEQRAPS